jgi:hypothetical protein
MQDLKSLMQFEGGETNSEFLWGNFLESDHLQDRDRKNRIILKSLN